MPGKYLWTPPERNTEDPSTPTLPGMPKLEAPRLHPGHPLYRQADNHHVWGELAHPDLQEHNPFLNKEISGYGSYSDRGKRWRQDHGGYADWYGTQDEPEGSQGRLEKHVQRTLNKSLPAIAISGHSLKQVLDSGRVKSQFETGASGGTLSPRAREEVEHQFFGYPKNLAPKARPIYGYLTHDPSQQHPVAYNYGAHTLVLHRPRVWHRTSVFLGDTLEEHEKSNSSAHPVQDFRTSGLPPHTDPKGFRLDSGPENYDEPAHAEAHYHGGVGLRDIHYAVLHKPDPWVLSHDHRVGEEHEALKGSLNQHKIPWTEVDHRGEVGHIEHHLGRLMASVQKGAYMQKDTKIIGQQGPHRYLIDLGYDNENGHRQAQIADVERGELHPPRSKDSILARGYWEDPTDDLDTADVLPLVKPV